MLNTDIEVFYDLELDPDEFVATCGPPFQNCNLAPTYDIANDFADVIIIILYKKPLLLLFSFGFSSFNVNLFQNNEEWLHSYVEAFNIMTSHGSENLQDLVK